MSEIFSAGVTGFTIRLTVDFDEMMRTWSPDRIRQFFAGIAQAVAAYHGNANESCQDL